MNDKFLVLLFSVFLSACTITGPADDGYDNNNEWVDNGRLLDDETKTIYKTSTEASTQAANQPSISPESDFAAYKQWQEAKEADSPEYQKFKQWQEFEDYQRWKEQQQSN